jgi:hypothetical protein
MSVSNKVIEDLMEFIKGNYELATTKFTMENNGNGIEKQLFPMNFEELTMDLTNFIRSKRNRITFLNLLEKYKEQKNMSDSEIYTQAWIDRRHFFKIINERLYHPTKKTIIALGIALKLNMQEMDEFLASCGFRLSYQSIFDLVIMFCIEREIYNIFDINALLVVVKQDVLIKE